jgi:hypothetical protein
VEAERHHLQVVFKTVSPVTLILEAEDLETLKKVDQVEHQEMVVLA